MRPLLLIAVLVSWACRGEASPEGEADGPASSKSSAAIATDRRPSASRLGAALAAARAVELPEPEVRLDFRRLETLHEATGGPGFVETLEATVQDTSGNAYELEVRIVHRAEPLAYRATLSRRTRGGRFDPLEGVIAKMRDQLPEGDTAMFARMRASSPLGPPEREFIRIGDRYWKQGPDGWTGPRDPKLWNELPEPTPLAALSAAFDGALPPARRPEPVGEEAIHGRSTTHHRVEDAFLVHTLWSALYVQLPTAWRGGSSGVADLWVQENGLILRARLRLHTPEGDEYAATLETRDFGEQPEIRPPG